jgi:hypothetical protein
VDGFKRNFVLETSMKFCSENAKFCYDNTGMSDALGEGVLLLLAILNRHKSFLFE